MSAKDFKFRDVSVPVYVQVKALSNISKCLAENKEIDKAIKDLLDEFKTYNNDIDMDFIKKSIFNISTCMYVLYFFVCCAKEYNLISKYNLGEERLCDVIETDYDIKMTDFTKFLRNAIAHIGFKFYENGNIDIYNSPKVECHKLLFDTSSNIDDIIAFLDDKDINDIKINRNENKQYEIIEQKYKKDLYTFTHSQFLGITVYYVEKFSKSIMHKIK